MTFIRYLIKGGSGIFPLMTKEYSYTVMLEQENDPEFKGYFNASVPALPGCFSYGATKEEALENIREAILCYLEDLRIHGEPLPDDLLPELKKVNVAICL